MIHTLNPNENFPIMRGIGNHTDTNTYYVRASIRDAVTDNVLATVDLADKGGQRFQTAWKVVYDNVFQKGRYITIVTSVYTDSGYTTKSQNYGDEFETYLVQERWDMAKIASIGGGGGIDYKELRKVVKEEIAKIEKPEKQKELDTKALVNQITDSVIDRIPSYPEQKETDLTGLEKAINSLEKKINTSIPKTATKQSKEIIDNFTVKLEELMSMYEKHSEDYSKEIEVIGNIIKELEKSIPEILSDAMDNKDLSLSLNLQPKAKDIKEDPNITRLKAKFNIK